MSNVSFIDGHIDRFDVDAFCEQLTDDWVLDELEVEEE